MEKKQSKPMGRPKMANPADQRLPVVRVTKGQLEAYKHAAGASGGSFSQWVRDCLDKGNHLEKDQ